MLGEEMNLAIIFRLYSQYKCGIIHLVAYGIPTITNAVEPWHRALGPMVACHHPTF